MRFLVLAALLTSALWAAAGPCFAQAGPVGAQAPDLSAAQAYRAVLAWAQGVPPDKIAEYVAEHATALDQLFDRVERHAYRYNILPEFALAMVAAEAIYGKRISWARYDSWAIYELKTGEVLPRCKVFDDLGTALSELRLIMDESRTVDEVIGMYWCGPKGDFNTASLPAFSEAVYKLWEALEPYAEARKASEDRSKYEPEYYGADDSDAPWSRLAVGDLEGYTSSLGAMPMLAKQLHSFGEAELAYVGCVREYNKHLSSAEATVIARAILTYCEQTGWLVDPRLIMAIVRAESAFRPGAVSKKGAMGLGQLMPATAKSIGIRDPFDPIQNLYGCVKYVERETYRWRNESNWLELVIASYNAGAGAVKKYGGVPPYPETQSFVRIVRDYYHDLLPEMKDKR